ncbi:hypothetical protein BJX68DRAFT_39370 [Aspergillus pseudodeflectus]|uniref:Uncharacterized protein n=1 Tax=Aspergillus pseudodeflectus TaxID=176178 RepID=A0ABR4KQ09_9EURO
MPGRTKQKYPVSIPELSETEIKLLIEALQTDTPQSIFTQNAKTYVERTHTAIRSLPPSLRAKIGIHLIPTPAFFSTAALCSVHKGLNKYIISHFIRMIKREVKGHLDSLTEYTWEPPKPYLDDVICTLRSLAGMWCSPSSSGDTICPKNPVPYQANKCEACMMARILMDQKCVQYLRATVLSRIRTTCNYRAPKLRRVTDTIIRTYDKGQQQEIIMSSSKIAFELKRARKEAHRIKTGHLRGNLKDKHEYLSQPRTRSLDDDADSPDCRPVSSITVDFCMIQEAPPPEEKAISPQEMGQFSQNHSQPIDLHETENASHTTGFSLSDDLFMSPEEAAFANNPENEEERQQDILLEIIESYMDLRNPSLISPQSASALAQPYIISPLSPRKNDYPTFLHMGTGAKNEYDSRDTIISRLRTPPRHGVDWDPILKRGKKGSPMDKLISQIGDLLDEQDGLGSRTASERAESYIAIIPEREEVYTTDEDDEAVIERRREPSDSIWQSTNVI